MLFVPGYAALRLVTSYAAPRLRHVLVNPDSLQIWWSRALLMSMLEAASQNWKHARCNKLFGFVWVSIVVASGKFWYRCRSGVPAQRTTLRRLSRALFMC